MWQNILLNWKSSSAGFGTILAAVADILTYAGKGQLTPNLVADILGISTGIGLIAAKDSSVTGTASK
jgi:hypothetical protein